MKARYRCILMLIIVSCILYTGCSGDSKADKTLTGKHHKNGGNCTLRITDECDSRVIEVFQEHGRTDIPIKKGYPDMNPISEFSFKADISSDREANMTAFRKYLANEFSKNPDEMPTKLKEAIMNIKGIDHIPETISGADIKKGLSAASLTLHEGADGMVHIIDRTVHETIRHSGGVSLARLNERLEALRNDFMKISTAAPEVIVSTYEEEAVYE